MKTTLPAVAAAALLSALPVHAQTWTAAPSLPAPNAGHAMASSNGYLYAFGGTADPLMACRLDTVAGTAWEPLSPPPAPLPGASAASHQGLLYVFSGSTIHAYDPASDTWTPLLATLSSPRTWASSARLGNRLYLAGGTVDSSDVAQFEELTPNPAQPSLGTVRPRAMLPLPSRGALAPIDNRLHYVYYSASQARWYATNYDPVADRWTAPAPITLFFAPGDRPACFVLQSTIYLAGPNSAGNLTLLYQWSTMPYSSVSIIGAIPGPAGRRALAATDTGDRGWISGGESPTAADALHAFTPYALSDAPSASNGAMRLPGGPDLPPGSSVTGPTLQFTATLTDPGETLRLEIEICPASEPFAGVPSAMTNLLNPAVTPPIINWPVQPGTWKWRYRAKDQWGYNSPWTDFGTADGTDFLYDAAPPGTPALLSPLDVDVPVADPNGGPVAFSWTAATDDASGVASYEIEVSRDPDFDANVAAASSGSESVSIHLRPGRDRHHWRVRAVDFAGRLGAWSQPANFRVVLVDGLDHGAGDARRVCGFSAQTGAPAWTVALAILTSLAAGLRAPRARAAGRGSRA